MLKGQEACDTDIWWDEPCHKQLSNQEYGDENQDSVWGASVASHTRPKILIGPSEGLGAEQATGGCSAGYNFDPVLGEHSRVLRPSGSWPRSDLTRCLPGRQITR
jgi:hypothetical protein